MTLEEMQEAFDNDDELLRFDRIKNKLSNRPDLHAFMLLDQLVPGDKDMISASEHDEFYLEIDAEELARVITPEQCVELNRCGVRYDSEYDCLAMFS